MKLKLLLVFCSCLFLLTEAYATQQEPYKGKKTKVERKGKTGTPTIVDKPLSEKVKKPSKSKPEKSSAIANRYIALKTNMAYQAVALQNLAADIQLSKSLSLEIPLIWSFWDMKQKHAIRTFTVQPELRWWTQTPGEGHFLGVHTHIGCFNIKWNDHRYQNTSRPLLGMGLSYGYLLPINEHWGAEFNLGAGYANTQYNTYYNIENGARINIRNKSYWGITRVGISLVYRF